MAPDSHGFWGFYESGSRFLAGFGKTTGAAIAGCWPAKRRGDILNHKQMCGCLDLRSYRFSALLLACCVGGKSLVYQVPAVVQPLVVVISPLVSLIQDQVQELCLWPTCEVQKALLRSTEGHPPAQLPRDWVIFGGFPRFPLVCLGTVKLWSAIAVESLRVFACFTLLIRFSRPCVAFAR